jgi:Bifunctional DNA primase/polymerase, N-terminal
VTARPERPEVAAHRYAAFGWPVFPLRPDGKEPLPKSNGFKDATTDPEKIDWWWRRDPERNVGIATGAPGPDVVDVDNHGDRGNGFGAWNKARAAGLVADPKAIIKTPSGGIHAYFAGSEQGNGKIAVAHMDFRGRGGYVVAPPSVVGGRPYVVVQNQAGPGGPVSWQAVRQVVSPQPERSPRRDWASPGGGRQQDLDHLVRYVAECTDHVNDRLFWAASRMVEAGQQARLPELVQAAYDAGEDRRGQAERTIQSALRGAQQQQAGPRPFEPASQRSEPAPQREAEAG